MEQPTTNPPAAPDLNGDELARRIDAARAGSDEALDKLLQACQGYLLSIANRELDSGVRGKLGASDVVQETLLEAHQAIGRFEGSTESDLLAWLRTILKHNLTDATRHYVRTEKRRVSREEPLSHGSQHVHDPISPAQTPSAMVGGDEEVDRLKAVLNRLPADYREVIDLRNWQLLPFGQIGEKMGRSEDAARKLWGRAIERLQQLMTETDGERKPRI